MLSAFDIYLTDALRTPFTAIWGAPGTSQSANAIILEDYRAYLAGGLPFDAYDQEE